MVNVSVDFVFDRLVAFGFDVSKDSIVLGEGTEEEQGFTASATTVNGMTLSTRVFTGSVYSNGAFRVTFGVEDKK